MRMLAVAISVMTALAATSAAVRADESKVMQPKKLAIAFFHLQGIDADVASVVTNPVVSGVECLPPQVLAHDRPEFSPSRPSGVPIGPPSPSGIFGYAEWHSPRPHGACDSRGFTAYRPVIQFDLSPLRGREVHRAVLVGVSPILRASSGRSCPLGTAVETTASWPGMDRWYYFKPFPPAAPPQFAFDKPIEPEGPSVARWDVTARERELVRDGKTERSYMIRGPDAQEHYFDAPQTFTACEWHFANFRMEFTLAS